MENAQLKGMPRSMRKINRQDKEYLHYGSARMSYRLLNHAQRIA